VPPANIRFNRTPKKPKSIRPTLLSGLGIKTIKKEAPTTVRKASTPAADGTREAPIPIDQDDTLPPPATLNQTSNDSTIPQTTGRVTDSAVSQSGVGQKRKRSAIMTVTGENGKKKKIVDETAFHPDLQKAITEMKGLVSKGMFRLHVCHIEKKNPIGFCIRVLGIEREIPAGTETSFGSVGFACH
jgi:hypothetical protein